RPGPPLQMVLPADDPGNRDGGAAHTASPSTDHRVERDEQCFRRNAGFPVYPFILCHLAGRAGISFLRWWNRRSPAHRAGVDIECGLRRLRGNRRWTFLPVSGTPLLIDW